MHESIGGVADPIFATVVPAETAVGKGNGSVGVSPYPLRSTGRGRRECLRSGRSWPVSPRWCTGSGKWTIPLRCRRTASTIG